MEWLGPSPLSRTEVDRVPVRAIGVYTLHVFDRRVGSYPVLYVGRSTDLNRRLNEHCDGSAGAPIVAVARRFRAVHFSILLLERESMLAPAESALIRLLRPPGNTQVPSAVPILVPVPPITTPFSRLRAAQPIWSS